MLTNSPLHDAIISNNIEAVKLLLRNGADVNFSTYNGKGGYNSEHPLSLALEYEYLDIANLLIEEGADINKARCYRNPIYLAASKGYIDIVSLILEKGANVNNQEVFAENPIHGAIENGKDDMVKYLLDQGADPSDSSYALTFAAIHCEVETVKLLLAKVGQVNPRDAMPPLSAAAMHGKIEHMELFIEAGADLNAGTQGETALDLAVKREQVEAVELLLSKGVNVTEEMKGKVQELLQNNTESFIANHTANGASLERIEEGQENKYTEQISRQGGYSR